MLRLRHLIRLCRLHHSCQHYGHLLSSCCLLRCRLPYVAYIAVAACAICAACVILCVTPLASLLPMQSLRRLRSLLAPHFLRPCYRLCHLLRLRRSDAYGAALQQSLPRSRGPNACIAFATGFVCVASAAALPLLASYRSAPLPASAGKAGACLCVWKRAYK